MRRPRTPYTRRRIVHAPQAVASAGTSAHRGLVGWGLALLVSALAGCGGGTTGDVDSEPLTPELPQVSGIVTDGTIVPDDFLEVTVKGRAGLARRTNVRLDLVPADYVASLDQLAGPYFLSATVSEPFLNLYSVASGPGTVNVTSLTTLVAAEVVARDPVAYFASLPGQGGFTDATDARIAEAHARVRRLLQRDYGFTVPRALVDFVATPFAPVAGDAMFDTLSALSERLAERGTTVLQLARSIGEEAGRCRLESVEFAIGRDSDRLCPLTRTYEPDADDASVSVLAFVNRRGDALSVRVRDDDVLDARLVLIEGTSLSCSAPACAGLAVGAPDDDGRRTLRFEATVLSGSGGPAVLDGEMLSAEPGVVLPGLPCVANFFYVIRAEAPVEGVCARPDDFGLGAAGGSGSPSGATQRIYTFDSFDPDTFAASTTLQVVTEGDAVVSALVFDYNDDGTAIVPLYQCRERDCPGVSLGPVTIDSSLGVDIETRTVTLDGARLPALLPDGGLSTSEFATLEGELKGWVFDDPSVPVPTDVPCAASAPTVEARPSDQADVVLVCQPDDSQGFTLSGTVVDGTTVTLFSQSLQTDGFGGYSNGSSVSVTTTAGVVTRVSFLHQGRGSVDYACEAAGCAGVTVSPPNGAGERTVAFSGTVLSEVGFASLPGTRTATLDGSFVAPPP